MIEKTTMDDRYIVLATRYLSGNISPEEQKELREWVAASSENTDEFQRVKNLWDASHPAFVPGQIDARAALQKVSEQMLRKEAKPRGRMLLLTLQRVAAVLFIPLLLCAGFFAWKAGSTPEPVIACNKVVSPYGVMSQLQLPDGSKVWLNTNSSITYPTMFERTGKRVVEMSGEAYFEVQSDVNHPFVVRIGGVDVQATGTQFNINAYDQTVVTLVEGRVGVRALDHDYPLLPDQQITITQEGEALTSRVDPFQSISWKDGLLAFRDARLEDVFKRLQQIYHVEFVIKDPEISSYIYRATFRGETIDRIVNLLMLSSPIRFEEVDSGKISDDEFVAKKLYVYKK